MPDPRLPTLEQRRAAGRALRDKCPRSEHAHWKLDRKRDLLPLFLEAQSSRLPKLLPHKYQLMSQSPFAFYRGSVWIMARDLAHLPASGIDAQICGDAHLRNLGAYAAPDGALVFDLNDFDETTRAPFEWDLKRLAASIVLVSRGAALSEDCAESAVLAMAAAYRSTIGELSTLGFLDLARYRVRHLQHADPVHLLLRKAERVNPLHSLHALTVKTARLPKFKKQLPTLTPVSGRTRTLLESALRDYHRTLSPDHQTLLDRYTPVDYAFKIVGTGSVALRDYVVLLLGNVTQQDSAHDPLFLQIKQSVPSAYAPYLRPSHAAWQHHGHRVAEGARKLQTQSDPLLGWTTIESRDYLVRQLNDHKASLDPADFAQPDALPHFTRVCGAVLARAHARTADPAFLHGYAGDNDKLDTALASFASAYATQVEADYTQFKKLLRKRKLRSR